MQAYITCSWCRSDARFLEKCIMFQDGETKFVVLVDMRLQTLSAHTTVVLLELLQRNFANHANAGPYPGDGIFPQPFFEVREFWRESTARHVTCHGPYFLE